MRGYPPLDQRNYEYAKGRYIERDLHQLWTIDSAIFSPLMALMSNGYV